MVSGAKPLCLRIIFPTTSFPTSPWKCINHFFIHFHGMAALFCSFYVHILLSCFLLLSFFNVPVPLRDFDLPSPLLAGSMQGGMASQLHSQKQGAISFPCPSSGVLFRLPSPGRSIIMAPLRASCHGKPRTGYRSLPSFFCYDPSVYPPWGRQIVAKLIVRCNLFQGNTS